MTQSRTISQRIRKISVENFKPSFRIKRKKISVNHKKIPLKNVKLSSKKKETQPTILKAHEKMKNPWFYCSLCSNFMKYSDLIDGCRCCFCDNDLFIVPGNEFTDYIENLLIKKELAKKKKYSFC